MDIKPEFDRNESSSRFLKFVASEFRQKGTELRNQLSSKEYAFGLVQGFGLKAASQYRVLRSIEALKRRHLKSRVVLKYAQGWAAQGVMLLEPLEKGRYFDHMTLKVHSLESIKLHQEDVAKAFGHARPTWILEEFLAPAQSVGAIPFDYKFYMFGAQVGVIVQFDRNSTPAKVAMFDGMFRPLTQGKDFVLTNTKNQPGVPLLPPHAAELQWWAILLSKQTDAPFVRVDLYDTPDGPAFGEYTFSPGATHKGTFKFSNAIVDYLDSLYGAAEQHLADGWKGSGAYPDNEVVQYNGLLAGSDLASVSDIGPSIDLYKIWSNAAYNHGSRGALRLRDYYQTASNEKKEAVKASVTKRFASNWEAIRNELKDAVVNRIDGDL